MLVRTIPPWLAALIFGWTHTGSAQTCHRAHPFKPDTAKSPLEPDLAAVYASFELQTATFRTRRYQGEYHGISLNAGWEQRGIAMHAELPGYRISRNGLVRTGVGNLLISTRAAIVRKSGIQAGLHLAATAPTGDPEQDLGMGHLMLMPGAWLQWSDGAASVEATASHGRALALFAKTHHNGSTGPIVNPMNASELEGSLNGAYRLGESMRVRGGGYGAVPVGLPGGVARAALFVGMTATSPSVSLGLEGHVAVAGDPFTSKLVVTAGAKF